MPKSNIAKRKRSIRKRPSTILSLAGIALLLIAIFTLKSVNNSIVAATSLESQLDDVLTAKRPTFVFLHPLDCIPGKEMMDIVEEVYADFRDSVVLIVMDVYDKNNQNILRRERLQSIPTLVFYNAQGTRQVFIGVMPPDQFRIVITQLVAGQ